MTGSPLLRRHMRKSSPTIFCIVIVACLLVTACNNRSKIYSMASFDSTDWKSSTTNRSKMIDDLCENHLYAKIPKMDVEKLLGPPSRVLAQAGYSKKDRDRTLKGVHEVLSYELPLDGNFDAHTFNVHLDAKGEYVGYHIFCN